MHTTGPSITSKGPDPVRPMSAWRPDFLSLRLFVAVCDEASISRAAEREALVPSAVSKRIAEIEESTGVQLLVRGNRGVHPTVAGTAFLLHARQILLTTARLHSDMADYANGVKGHIRMAANVSSIMQFLPKDISSFMAKNPGIRIDLEEAVSSTVHDSVRSGLIDIGVGLPQAEMEGIHQLPYENDRLVVLLYPGHPLAGKQVLEFSEILGEDFVSTQPNASTTTLLSTMAARFGRVLHYRIHVSTIEALCHIVHEKLAIAIVSAGVVRPLQDALQLSTVRLADSWAARNIVVWHGESLSLAAGHLLAHLQESADGRRLTSGLAREEERA